MPWTFADTVRRQQRYAELKRTEQQEKSKATEDVRAERHGQGTTASTGKQEEITLERDEDYVVENVAENRKAEEGRTDEEEDIDGNEERELANEEEKEEEENTGDAALRRIRRRRLLVDFFRSFIPSFPSPPLGIASTTDSTVHLAARTSFSSWRPDYLDFLCPIDDGLSDVGALCGHCNVRTVKDVNWFGLRSEFIVTGSDCGRIFFYDATGPADANFESTSRIVQVLEDADSDVVNICQSHPHATFLASSGIDHSIKLWAPRYEMKEEI